MPCILRANWRLMHWNMLHSSNCSHLSIFQLFKSWIWFVSDGGNIGGRHNVYYQLISTVADPHNVTVSCVELHCLSGRSWTRRAAVGKKRHWDPARIQTWVLWIPVRCSYQLSHWNSSIGAARGRWHLSIDTVQFSGWISLRLGKLHVMSTKIFWAATS